MSICSRVLYDVILVNTPIYQLVCMKQIKVNRHVMLCMSEERFYNTAEFCL